MSSSSTSPLPASLPCPPTHIQLVERRCLTGGSIVGIDRVTQTLDFDLGFYMCVKAIKKIRASISGCVFVAIAGPSGAGKTSLANQITSILPHSVVISMDNYLDSTREVIDFNFDDFRLMDFDLLNKNLMELSEGKSTNTPLYDFRKSGRYAWREFSIPPSRVVILEGTYALHEQLVDIFNLKISVSGGVHFDLVKRITRDITRTGQNPDEALTQIVESVYPMYKGWIKPDLDKAALRIINNYNPFSGLLAPMYTLKSMKVPSAAEIEAALMGARDTKLGGPCTVTRTTEKYFDVYFLPPIEEAEVFTKDHFIRVRNLDGRYFIMFSEHIRQAPFLISPRIEFPVTSKILGGLLSLEYRIYTKMDRESDLYSLSNDNIIVSVDRIQDLDCAFVQLKGPDRERLLELGTKLGLSGTYTYMSYIELFQEHIQQLVSDPDLPNSNNHHNHSHHSGGLHSRSSSSHSLISSQSSGDLMDPSGASSVPTPVGRRGHKRVSLAPSVMDPNARELPSPTEIHERDAHPTTAADMGIKRDIFQPPQSATTFLKSPTPQSQLQSQSPSQSSRAPVSLATMMPATTRSPLKYLATAGAAGLNSNSNGSSSNIATQPQQQQQQQQQQHLQLHLSPVPSLDVFPSMPNIPSWNTLQHHHETADTPSWSSQNPNLNPNPRRIGSSVVLDSNSTGQRESTSPFIPFVPNSNTDPESMSSTSSTTNNSSNSTNSNRSPTRRLAAAGSNNFDPTQAVPVPPLARAGSNSNQNQYQNQNPSSNPQTLTQTNFLDQRELALHHRELELNQRAAQLDQSERAVRDRESELYKLDRALADRERVLADRERRVSALASSSASSSPSPNSFLSNNSSQQQQQQHSLLLSSGTSNLLLEDYDRLRLVNRNLENEIVDLRRELKRVTLMAQYDLQATVLHKDEIIEERNRLLQDMEEMNGKLLLDLELLQRQFTRLDDSWRQKSVNYKSQISQQRVELDRLKGFSNEDDANATSRIRDDLISRDDDGNREYEFRKYYAMLQLESRQQIERLRMAFRNLNTSVGSESDDAISSSIGPSSSLTSASLASSSFAASSSSSSSSSSSFYPGIASSTVSSRSSSFHRPGGGYDGGLQK